MNFAFVIFLDSFPIYNSINGKTEYFSLHIFTWRIVKLSRFILDKRSL